MFPRVLKMIREITILSIVVFSQSGYTCELTDEYAELKKMYAKTSELAHLSCVTSIENANYWFQHNQCLEANDGKNVSGGCGVVVGNEKKKYKSLSVGPEICAGTAPESKLYEQSFQNTVQQLKVTKCKKT